MATRHAKSACATCVAIGLPKTPGLGWTNAQWGVPTGLRPTLACGSRGTRADQGVRPTSLVTPARRAGFGRSGEFAVARELSTCAKGSVAGDVVEPTEKSQLLDVIWITTHRDEGCAATVQRVAHFQFLPATSRLDFAFVPPGRGGVSDQWIVHPFGDFMGGSLNIAPNAICRPSPGLYRAARGVVLAPKNAGCGRRIGMRGYDVLGQEKRELCG